VHTYTCGVYYHKNLKKKKQKTKLVKILFENDIVKYPFLKTLIKNVFNP